MKSSIVVLITFISISCRAYHRSPCTTSISRQFQFENCYAPNLNPDLSLNEASFVMSHNSATGYLNVHTANNNNNTYVSNTKDAIKTAALHRVLGLYGKTQVGTAYEQLNNGARALDLRPKLYNNNSIGFHHGDMIDLPLITIDLSEFISEVKSWCSDNPGELVLIFHSELVHELGNEYLSSVIEFNNQTMYSGIAAMQQVYDELQVPYFSCEELAYLKVGDVMNMADLSRFGGEGYLLAVDRHDMYASFCGKANWSKDNLVTCYSTDSNSSQSSTQSFIQCTDLKKSGQYKLSQLQSYAKASANNEPTNSAYELGPPANMYWYPFNQIQAFWQVDTASVQIGLLHGSSLLDDNRLSKINAILVDMVYNQEFDSISIFTVDNVALNGLALFSVLRNACGQAAVSDEDVLPCGKDLSMPHLNTSHSLPFLWDAALCLAFGIVLVGAIVMVFPAFKLRDEGPQDHRLVCHGHIV